jgi:hypothetical protein
MKSIINTLMALGILGTSLNWGNAQSVAPRAGGSASSLGLPAPGIAPPVEARPRTIVSPSQNANVFGQTSVADYGAGYGYVRSSGSSVPPVVIQFGGNSPDGIAKMEEDLEVMTHIIDRALDRMGENVPDEKMGIRLIYSGGKSVRALYLENFGPLFMVKVNFPVHAPSDAQTKSEEKEEDSEWNRVRRTLYGQSEDVRWVSSGVPYEAERVEALKKQLVAAVKNASNMKGVKPDEHVTITVFGTPALVGTSETRSKRSVSGSGSGSSGGGGSGGGLGQSSSAGAGVVGLEVTPKTSVAAVNEKVKSLQKLESARTALQGTVLTLRVKKSDIDAAANESDETLMKKVAFNTYSGNGQGVTSVNSWIRSSSSSSSGTRY